MGILATHRRLRAHTEADSHLAIDEEPCLTTRKTDNHDANTDCRGGACRQSRRCATNPAPAGRIRAADVAAGRRIAALDDDPTGSQAVHGVQVVTVLEEEAYAAALAGPAATCFVLTNTRSLEEPAAAEINVLAARGLVSVAGRRGARLQLVSRSDSTLRGHVMAEVTALDLVRRETAGRGYDGVLLVPAFLEAGRLTAGDIHWARVGGRLVPVGETEFARDAVFGYTASDLRDFVADKSGGTIGREEVGSIGLADIRLGGPQRVRELLAGVRDGAGSWSTPPNTPTWTRSRPGC